MENVNLIPPDPPLVKGGITALPSRVRESISQSALLQGRDLVIQSPLPWGERVRVRGYFQAKGEF